MKKKKLLFLISSLDKGGAEKVLINLLKKIDRNKYDIELCVVMQYGVYIKDIPKDIKTFYLLKNTLLARIFTFLQVRYGIEFFYRYLIRWYIKEQYDIAISFSDSSYTELLFYIAIKPLKIVTWIHASYASHDNYSKFYNPSYKKKLIKKRYNKVDTIVFVSNDSMDDFIRIFGKFPDMRVIHNILDTVSIQQKSLEKKMELSDKINLISIGRLLPVKGYDKLINACSILKNEGLSFTLYILGDGILKSTLSEQVKVLGLQDSINFIGFTDNPYVYLKAADIFVMSSLSEALPTALCEAMILGKPVLVTNCNGCRELVDNGKFGFMVEQTSEELAKGISILLKNNTLLEKYKTLSLERAFSFRDEKVLEEIETLFNS